MLTRYVRYLVFGVAILLPATLASAADDHTHIIVDSPLPPPAKLALTDLENALQRRNEKIERKTSVSKGPHHHIVVGIAGRSPHVDQMLAENSTVLPKPSESLCVSKFVIDTESIVVIAGRDVRGLIYALLDVTRAIELTPKDKSWVDAIASTTEQPFLRHRSVTIHLANRDLDGEWYYDEAFWREYFTMLARDRFNNFTLTFADQMNYLNPVYAHLVDVPGFEDVRASDVTADGKRRNLKMLRRITELADERGIDFTFGVWTQQPVKNFGGEITVQNMPKGQRFMDYCAGGLTAVLKDCPSIDMVQFRMNAESGIDEDAQTAYYQSQFDAIRNCGRPVRLELRYKGLREATIQQAIKTGLDLTVSTKFWCEHLGLPYHPTVEDTHYRESRYGYGAMLSKPRDYRVIYRLWTVGSHRLLLWADPDYASRFAKSCRLGDGEGFEIFAPLTNKGYENTPGKWRIFADRSHESCRWEQQRYWFYYLVFGRMGYNPKCYPEAWQRELRHRFGKAAEGIETAYRSASQILPLITATRTPSASEWRWWPEMDTGGPLNEYIHTPPSDTAQFYGIRTWRRTENWWREDWDEFPSGYVDDKVAGRITGRWTPEQVAEHLRELAIGTMKAMPSKSARKSDESIAEFHATSVDLRLQAFLALYHSWKTRAATNLAFFQMTGETRYLPIALRQMEYAMKYWSLTSRLAGQFYSDNLVFGHRKDSPRSRGGHHHSGHWKDRLPEVQADVDYLRNLIRKHNAQGPREFITKTQITDFPRIEHEPIESATVGKDFTLRVKVTSKRPIFFVRLYFRALNQTVDWNQIQMKSIGKSQFEAIVPGDEVSARWDFMYYFEAIDEQSGTLWPKWQERQPYIVVKTRAERN